jgi:hypothetical protein
MKLYKSEERDYSTSKIGRMKNNIRGVLKYIKRNSDSNNEACFGTRMVFRVWVDFKTGTIEYTVYLASNIIYQDDEFILFEKLIPTTSHKYIRIYKKETVDFISEEAQVPYVSKTMKIKLGSI